MLPCPAWVEAISRAVHKCWVCTPTRLTYLIMATVRVSPFLLLLGHGGLWFNIPRETVTPLTSLCVLSEHSNGAGLTHGEADMEELKHQRRAGSRTTLKKLYLELPAVGFFSPISSH